MKTNGAWMNIKGHAVANGVYVAAANRISNIYLIQQELNFGEPPS
jgi:hypothetical protein